MFYYLRQEAYLSYVGITGIINNQNMLHFLIVFPLGTFLSWDFLKQSLPI